MTKEPKKIKAPKPSELASKRPHRVIESLPITRTMMFDDRAADSFRRAYAFWTNNAKLIDNPPLPPSPFELRETVKKYINLADIEFGITVLSTVKSAKSTFNAANKFLNLLSKLPKEVKIDIYFTAKKLIKSTERYSSFSDLESILIYFITGYKSLKPNSSKLGRKPKSAVRFLVVNLCDIIELDTGPIPKHKDGEIFGFLLGLAMAIEPSIIDTQVWTILSTRPTRARSGNTQ